MKTFATLLLALTFPVWAFFLLLTFLNFGAAYLICCSKLFEAPRASFEGWLLFRGQNVLAAGLRCPACVSFWLGAGWGLGLWIAYSETSFATGLVWGAMLGLWSCGTTLYLGLTSGLVSLSKPGCQ